MEKSKPSGSSFVDHQSFEVSIHRRLKPLTVAHGIKIEHNQPIKIRPANTYFTRDRSWRCSFLCGAPNEFVLVEARLDFNPLWLMQLEMLAAYNPAALQRLIIVCPRELEIPSTIARLTVVHPEYLIDRILANLQLN
jgi:hypothetical protein